MPQIGQIGFPFGKSSGFSQFFPICPTCFFPGKHLHFLGDFQLPWLMFQPVESIYSTSSSHFAGCAGANRARAARAPMGIDVMHRSVSVQTWMCPERGYGLSRYTQRKMCMCDGQFALYNEIWIPSGHLALQWKASVVNHE